MIIWNLQGCSCGLVNNKPHSLPRQAEVNINTKLQINNINWYNLFLNLE